MDIFETTFGLVIFLLIIALINHTPSMDHLLDMSMLIIGHFGMLE